MNELQIFNSEEFGDIRTVTIDNEPWFVGKDVAEILGYERGTKAVVDHVDAEDRKMLDGEAQSYFGIELGQRGDLQSATNIIAEGRCYMLDLEKKKRQEINNMVAILEQIDLPDIILLTRDANTLLLRQQEQCRDAESKRNDG